MPQRFLKPGITTSEKWNACDWQTQSFYIRLITMVDDYGRMEAHPLMLRGHCFAMREDVTRSNVESMCRELSRSGLAVFYESGGKPYLQLTNWKENARADSKFPAFDNTCTQMFTAREHLQTNVSEPQTNVSDPITSANKCYPPQSSSSSSPVPSPSSVPQPPPLPLPPASPSVGGDDVREAVSPQEPVSPEAISPQNAAMARIGAWFNRRRSTPWSEKEIRALKMISPIQDEDMKLMEDYYAPSTPPSPAKDYRRRDVLTLLNNWTGELDRARRYNPSSNVTNHEAGF